MDIYGLVGRKLGHSFSREFFSNMFKVDKINADYLNFEMPSVDDPLCGVMAIIERYPGLRGLTVTIPFKKDVLKLLNYVDPIAVEIGAVNTIKIDRQNNSPILAGYNTDIIGFTSTLRPLIEPQFTRKALVLGTGGASLAVKCGLQKLGFEVTGVSRNASPGLLTYGDLHRDQSIIKNHSVIVNTTPLGMWPDVDSAPDLPYEALDSNHLLYDAVYNPDPTRFMQLGAQYGAKTCSGIGMLRGQALASWSIWNS